jgi:hypothetical protein
MRGARHHDGNTWTALYDLHFEGHGPALNPDRHRDYFSRGLRISRSLSRASS